ncbi:MAG: thiamine phosphate synthase [bacterium]|nr:thiamine phosphate synthase [bacterium]
MNSKHVQRVRGIYPLADDDPRWPHDVRAQVEAMLEGGASVIQLRLKHTDDGEALELAAWAAGRATEAGALLIINDRFDLADLSGAHGVHLGHDDLPPERVPKSIREKLIVGLSTHTLEQVEASRTRPIDYVAFGPVFGTRSKDSEYAARGLALLSEAVTLAVHPLVAIGGIDAQNLAGVCEAGASAAALISAITAAEDPFQATRYLVEGFESAHSKARKESPQERT